jgi:hypothetical protein
VQPEGVYPKQNASSADAHKYPLYATKLSPRTRADRLVLQGAVARGATAFMRLELKTES